MSKKEEFKIFISKHPELVSYIKSKEYTWQDFYEIFDIYGDNKEVWDKYKNKNDYEDRQVPLNELTNIVKNINMDNVQKYINNAQKAISVIQELTSKNPVKTSPVPKTPRPITKFFGD
ncbi:MAG: spore coat protein YlbD [Bacilli bacterium]|nr:spore coat protein YlbD [Bacilli bacterium]